MQASSLSVLIHVYICRRPLGSISKPLTALSVTKRFYSTLGLADDIKDVLWIDVTFLLANFHFKLNIPDITESYKRLI